MCYRDHSVWTVCAHSNVTQHTCKRGPFLSTFSACLGWSACKPNQKWVYRIRLGFCPECVEVFEPQFSTKDLRAILNYWTWKAGGDASADTRYSHCSPRGILRAHPYDVPIFQIWGVPARPELPEEELLLEYELLARQLDMFWIPDGPNRLAAAIQARRATSDYFSALEKGLNHTGRRGCYPPREFIPHHGQQPDAEPVMPIGFLVRQGTDDEGSAVRHPPIDLTVPRTRHALVNSPARERVRSHLGNRRGNNHFAPPQLRREEAFLVDDQDGQEFHDIELDEFPLTGQWASASEILSSPAPRAGEGQLDEEHSHQDRVHNDGNAPSIEPSREVSMSLVTSLVDNPYVEARDAVAISFTNPGQRPVLTGSPSGANTRIPEPRAISRSRNQKVDPASVELPEVDMEEIYYFLRLQWPAAVRY
ncbi:hypothetical protein B0T18DRAFT_106611 [Schizothecium vesticola]|uniref:Uncharacterized protein n=1 Tax=Schizothecium vesticola TaxID=314040 RepID=A0AA40F1I0_9PEZI|nr:hypothetical protein B0T18DRAFT_106611 [Schizothecium vesticola]